MGASGSSEVPDLGELDIAVAHWHVNAWGGAEYVATKLAEAVNNKIVYTLGQPDPSDSNPYGDVDFQDVTSKLDYSWLRRLQRKAGRVFEYAQWEDVDWRRLGDPDVIITSGSTTRAIITPDDTLHLNYCHSPPRWFYDLYHDRKRSLGGSFARPILRYLRIRDTTVDPRVDHYFANSPVIARRLFKYYKRDAEVLYPPVEIENYTENGDEGFYLHLGRLDTEKGVEAVVEAFESLDHPIVFAGGAGDAEVLDRIQAANNMEYEGFVSEDRKYELLSTCRAVVFNGRNEDFGIVPIEANASGKPCIARNDGFPGMYIQEGVNGFLHAGSSGSIQEAISGFEARDYDGEPTKYVDDFTLQSFEQNLTETIEREFSDLRDRFAIPE